MNETVPRRARSLKPRARPVQSRGARTLDAVLAAAHHVLKHGGIETLTMLAVAQQAGVAIGTVYRLFPNKEAIVCRVYEDKIAAVLAAGEPIRLAAVPGDDWRETLTRYIRTLKAAERGVDFDLGLANAVFLIPEIRRLDVLHAIRLADRVVVLLKVLGARWSDAALFDLAMTQYCLEAASWQYANTCGADNATLSERLLACALLLTEPAMRGDPEPPHCGMNRARLLADYGG